MIKGFEEYTVELTTFEESIVPTIHELFEHKSLAGKANATTGAAICKRFNERFNSDTAFRSKFDLSAYTGKRKPPKLTLPRLGKIIAYIRQNQMCWIAGNSDGYFRAITVEEKLGSITSLYQRVMGVLAAIDGLENIEKFKGRDETFYKYRDKMGIYCDRNML